MSNGCTLCPLSCGVDRSKVLGRCGIPSSIKIAKFGLHTYEEPIISGTQGSGTIFFCGCSLKCAFCQNYALSRNLRGKTISTEELADIFRKLEDMGAHNVNLVSPTQYSDKIISALKLYRPKIPVIYNTHGYEKKEIIQELFDYVDVFLPDIKFYSPALSERYTGIRNYFDYASRAIELMADKPLSFNDAGLIKSGTVVRHLVLPQCISDSKKILDWFCGIKDKAYIDVMSQYTPFGRIEHLPELKRKLTHREYDTVINYAISLGIDKMFYQKPESASEIYIPHWDY